MHSTRRFGVCFFSLLILALGLAAAPGLAQAGGGIEGEVSASDGARLPGATVTARNLASGIQESTFTSAEGAYALKDLPAGTYRLSVSLDGFATQGKTVALAAGETAEEDFDLSLGALDEAITITAARGERAIAEIPQTVTVISEEDLQERRPRSVQEAFERVPNMDSIEANAVRSRPTYRGQSSSRLLLLLDGERINNARIDANATGLSPGMIDINQIASIEVVGGAGSSLYGTDAHAGTINLITKNPDRPSTGSRLDVLLDLTYSDNGDFDREYASVSYGTSKWGARVGISRFDQKSYDAGDEEITQQDVLALGELSNQLAGNANTYTIWSLPAGGEVSNGQADGTNTRADLWYYFNDQHSLRATYLGSEHDDLGSAFSTLPYNNVVRLNEFRDFDKFTLRYEATELADWLPRLSARIYQQEFQRPQNDRSFTVDLGSSYLIGDQGTFFTGNPSTFTSGGTDSETLNTVESSGGEVQLNIRLGGDALLTTGLQFVQDESKDRFTRQAFDSSNTVTSTLFGATTPDTEYENLGWFSQIEWQPAEWVRLAGGLRWDRWESTTSPTANYPLPGGSELGLLDIAATQLSGTLTSLGFNLAGVGDFVNAVQAGQSFSTDNDVWTSNVGATFFLPGGFNPYVRWGESYREPEVTVRYLVRNFGSAFFGVQSSPNPFLDPEEGESLEFGIKVDKANWRGSLAFFESEIDNFIDGIVSPTLFFAPNPAAGVIGPLGLFFQRVNRNAVEFEGVEAYFEGSVPVGGGSLTPYVSLSWLDGRNKNPTAAEVALIEQFYNRNDTPIRLEGSAGDVPFGSVVPFQGTVALRYTSGSGKWYGEYEWKFADDITRVRPESVATGNITQFGILKSLEGYERHALRGGYDFGTQVPLKVTLGIENLTDELIFLPFQIAPAPGRSFTLGLTYKWGRNS